MNPIVHLDDVSVCLGHKKIITSMSYLFEQNNCYALIGKNGSGKTTLLRTIAGLIQPTHGTVSIDTPSIGYAPDHFTPPAWITVYAFMWYNAQLANIHKNALHTEITQRLEYVGLQEDTQALCSTLSRGQMKRLCIAQACLGNPKLLLLDEPLSGIDPEGIEVLTFLMNSMLAQGSTILYATHTVDGIRDIQVPL